MTILYSVCRPILRALAPESAHRLALTLLATGAFSRTRNPDHPSLSSSLACLRLPNPVGLAAGFDKDGVAISGIQDLGFGFVEIGSVTPRPQYGNPRPRLFRLDLDQAVINRMGFNNAGFDALVHRLDGLSEGKGVIGVNIGANKDSTNPIADYSDGIIRFAKLVDYMVINISSPNTPGLRDLQLGSRFQDLVSRVISVREDTCPAKAKTPIFLKIAPDLTTEDITLIVNTSVKLGVNGLIVSNTTTMRPPSLLSQNCKESGGLSGRPLFSRSTQLLGEIYRLSNGCLPLIGCGGITSGADAYAKICAGASALQLYTSLVFHGPGVIKQIKRELVSMLASDGFSSIMEAVGSRSGLSE